MRTLILGVDVTQACTTNWAEQAPLEPPLRLPDIDEEGMTALRRWRYKAGLSPYEAADIFGVSVSTYYRYETGDLPGMARVIRTINKIISLTGANLRYGDLLPDFNEDYA